MISVVLFSSFYCPFPRRIVWGAQNFLTGSADFLLCLCRWRSVLWEPCKALEDPHPLVEITPHSLTSSSETSDMICMRSWILTQLFSTSHRARPAVQTPGAEFLMRINNPGREDKQLWYSVTENRDLMFSAQHQDRSSSFLPVGCSL